MSVLFETKEKNILTTPFIKSDGFDRCKKSPIRGFVPESRLELPSAAADINPMLNVIVLL